MGSDFVIIIIVVVVVIMDVVVSCRESKKRV